MLRQGSPEQAYAHALEIPTTRFASVASFLKQGLDQQPLLRLAEAPDDLPSHIKVSGGEHYHSEETTENSALLGTLRYLKLSGLHEALTHQLTQPDTYGLPFKERWPCYSTGEPLHRGNRRLAGAYATPLPLMS